MPRLALTQKAVAKLAAPHPDGKQTVYWDTETRGFGVVCSGKTNQRLYIAQRDVGGKTRRVKLGTVSGLTLEAARRDAEDALNDMRKGVDPKKKKTPTYTLRSALTDFLAARHSLRPASVIAYRQIERVLASWMALDLPAITPEMVEARHRSIAKEIGSTTANMSMRVLRSVWNFAAGRAPLPPNPVARLKRQWFAEKRRKGRVQDHELPAFFAAVQALPSRTAADYIALLLFTGLRKTETASLRWTDVDLVRKVITVRAEETKAGRELVLPMADFVLALMVRRRALGSASPYVFPGSGKTGHVVGALKALAIVHRACGVRVSVHDLRRTYATVAAPEVSWLVMKTLLNHATGNDVTAGYVQVTENQLREAVQRVAAKMEKLCGITPVAAKNVTKLRRK